MAGSDEALKTDLSMAEGSKPLI